MRIGPWELSLRRGQTKAEQTVQVAASSQSEHYKGVLNIGGTIPTTVNYAIILQMIQAIPFLDVGLRKFTRLVNGFGVEADNDRLQEVLDEFLREVVVDQVQVGFRSFETRHVRSLLQYGKALGEIVLTDPGTDIAGLVNINSPKVVLKVEDGGVVLGEKRLHGQDHFFPNQELLLYNIANPIGDDLHGVPLLQSAPFAANIILTTENAVRQMWQRSGAPPFLLFAKLPTPEDGELPPGLASSIEGTIKGQWNNAMRDRWNGEGIRDFTLASQAEFSVSVIGADITELNFEVPYRAMMEQIISCIELAPFMLGISWATTERLSAEQADMIGSSVEDVRAEVTPDYMKTMELAQAMSGVAGSFKPIWTPYSLKNELECSTARKNNAQAQQIETTNAIEAWRQGWIDQEQAAEEAGFELEKMADPGVVAPIASTSPPAIAAALSAMGQRGQRAFENYPG